jgi:hypothetical protein
MRRRLRLAGLLALLATLMWTVESHQRSTLLAAGTVSWVDQIRSENAQVRTNAAFRLRSWRSDTIAGLIQVTNDPSLREQNPEAVETAINLLGSFKAAEASDTLVQLVTFLPPSWRPAAPSLPSPYSPSGIAAKSPAVDALVEIGSPALPAVIGFASSGKAHGDEISYLAHAVNRILGKECGKIFLQEEFAKAKTQLARGGLKELMRVVAQTPP